MSNGFKNELFEAILSLGTKEECERFFSDLCTEREISDLSARLRVAKLLDAGENYNDIAAATGASTATISRVSKCLSGAAGGYRTVLANESRQNKVPNKLSELLYDGEKAELLLREIFLENDYTPKGFPSLINCRELLGYPEYSDTAALVIFQNKDGELTALSPDMAPAALREPDGARISYAEKTFKRTGGGISAERTLGVVSVGSPDKNEKRKMLELAMSAARIKNRNAYLSVFDGRITALIFEKLGLSDDIQRELFAVLDRADTKRLYELFECGKISATVKNAMNLLIKLPAEYADAEAAIRAICPCPELAALLNELSSLTAGLDIKKVRLEVQAPSCERGLSFSSRKAQLSGREYISPGAGMGFRVTV